MFTDLCLRADTEAELKAALPWAVQDGEWVTGSPQYALDLIGSLQTKEAVPGEPDGPMAEEAEFDTRFHANLRLVDGFDPDVPEAVIIHPTQQRRVFA